VAENIGSGLQNRAWQVKLLPSASTKLSL